MKLELAAEKTEEQRHRINAIRDQLDSLPVHIDAGAFQADLKSLSRMARSRDNPSSVTEMKTSRGEIKWVRADNTEAVIAAASFPAFVDEITAAVTAREDALFAHALALKQMLPVADDSPIFDVENWPTAGKTKPVISGRT